jgi:hypothetical protein
MDNVISLKEFGAVWDRDGYMLFEHNLKSIFDFIIEKGLLKDKKQKYVFYISIVVYVNGNISVEKIWVPQRRVKESTKTIHSLLIYWKKTFRKSFFH